MKNILKLILFFCRYFYHVFFSMGAIDPPSLGFGVIQKWTSPCIVRSFSRIGAPRTLLTIGCILIASRRIFRPQSFYYMRKTSWDSKNCYNRLQAFKCKKGRRKGLLSERENRLKMLNLINRWNPIGRLTWMQPQF
jgi:hypothetical protein